MDTIDLEHEKRLTEVEQRSRSNAHRIEKLEESSEALTSLATSVAVMVEKQNSMADKQDTMVLKVDSISKEVATIKEAPGKRWEKVVEQIIGLIVAAVVGYIIAHIGL